MLANQAFAMYVNKDLKELKGKHYYKLFSQVEAEVRMRKEEDAAKIGGKSWIEKRGKRSLSVTIIPLKMKEMEIEGMIRIENDITDLLKK